MPVGAVRAHQVHERRMGILWLAREGRTGGSGELAERYGVTERTINRDIGWLKQRYPIRWDRREGSFVLREGHGP